MSKKFMENALWILKSVYYMEKPEKITKEITKRMSTEEIARVMVFLENKGWIKVTRMNEPGPFHINLTDKGTEYLVNEMSRKRQEEFNMIIAVTAAILALIGIYDFLAKLNLIKSFNWITAIFVVLTIGALAIIITFLINSYIGRN